MSRDPWCPVLSWAPVCSRSIFLSRPWTVPSPLLVAHSVSPLNSPEELDGPSSVCKNGCLAAVKIQWAYDWAFRARSMCFLPVAVSPLISDNQERAPVQKGGAALHAGGGWGSVKRQASLTQSLRVWGGVPSPRPWCGFRISIRDQQPHWKGGSWRVGGGAEQTWPRGRTLMGIHGEQGSGGAALPPEGVRDRRVCRAGLSLVPPKKSKFFLEHGGRRKTGNSSPGGLLGWGSQASTAQRRLPKVEGRSSLESFEIVLRQAAWKSQEQLSRVEDWGVWTRSRRCVPYLGITASRTTTAHSKRGTVKCKIS